VLILVETWFETAYHIPITHGLDFSA